LRLGFVVVPERHVRRFRHALGDWPLHGLAIAVGIAAYRDERWRAIQRRRMARAAERLDELLERAGLAVEGGTPLFRLARCANAEALFGHLAARSILTRPFADDATLLRIGLPGNEQSLHRLAAALRARPA